MHNDLNGEGTGIQGRAEVACQQAALDAAMSAFDDIETPATDAVIADIEARGVEKFVLKIASDLRTAGGAWGVFEEPYHEVADHIEDRGNRFSQQLRSGKGAV